MSPKQQQQQQQQQKGRMKSKSRSLVLLLLVYQPILSSCFMTTTTKPTIKPTTTVQHAHRCDDGDSEARSLFGTKEYWDDMYQGLGDFPSEEYQWYYGFDKYSKYVLDFVKKNDRILIPGIGNDPILIDLLSKKFTKICATDYSEHAIERQQDILSYSKIPDNVFVELQQMDARNMPSDWNHKFDAILEKGALDAIYLSGDGNLELAAKEFARVVKQNGILISVSGVVPAELRRNVFDTDSWEWIRDGSDDLEAGCFVMRRKVIN
jgi:SAM-dependent methyltransferase